jgi:hypothetical protein
MINKRIANAGLILLIMVSIFGVATQDLKAAGIKMKVDLGFSGYVTPGRWVPLQIQFSDRVDTAEFELIKVNDEGAFSPLERYSVRNINRIEIPIYIGVDTTTLKLKLLSNGLSLAEQVIDVRQRRYLGHLILAMNIPGQDQQAIERALLPKEPILVVPVDYMNLPGLEWNYDGVSRLIVNDPGRVLTPAQIRSLHSWISCGGRMVVFSTKDASDSIVADLSSQVTGSSKIKSTSVNIGTGNIYVNPPSLHQSNPQAWQQLLSLKPYAQEVNLTPSKIFSLKSLPQNHKSNLINRVMIIIIVWALTIFLLIWLRIKWRIIFAFTLLSLFLTIPLAKWLTFDWPRGADTHVRMILLPDNGGAIINAQVSLEPSKNVFKLVSPWGVKLTLAGKESGAIHCGNQRLNYWSHKALRPKYINRSFEPTLLDLIGWFPDISIGLSTVKPDAQKILINQADSPLR